MEFLPLTSFSTMSLPPPNKEILIIGDSNVEKNLIHTGRLYSQQCESVPASNLDEFAEAALAREIQIGHICNAD
jgi:hypothetical protein